MVMVVGPRVPLDALLTENRVEEAEQGGEGEVLGDWAGEPGTGEENGVGPESEGLAEPSTGDGLLRMASAVAVVGVRCWGEGLEGEPARWDQAGVLGVGDDCARGSWTLLSEGESPPSSASSCSVS